MLCLKQFTHKFGLDSIKKHLEEKYPHTRIDLIYNGLSLTKYSHAKCMRLSSEPTRLAIVGRVISHKGQFEAIKAIEYIVQNTNHNVLLNIVGVRPEEMTDYENMLVTYVEKQGLSNNVNFVPFTDKVEEVLADCDIGLTCSKKEAFGRVTVEYMLSYLLAIGANSGGTPEVITNKESGLLYDEGDSVSLAKAIIWAIEHPDEANRIISNGHKKATSSFSSISNAKQVYALYKEILLS